ncbi:helix-turn-helix transcriptional regulator [soil metagenome]
MPRSPDRIDALVGARIVALRAEAGLTQAQLAARLGISFQQVQKYEVGANRVSASRLHQLATIFGAPIDSFFPAGSPSPGAGSPPDWRELRFMTASAEGRSVATGFGLIDDREVRRALAVIVGALSKTA